MAQPPPPRPRRSRSSAGKRMLIGLVVFVACILAAYFIGLNKGKAGMAALQSEVTQAKADTARLQWTNNLLQTRATIQSAVADLERRNFGTAQTKVESAAKTLESLPPDAAVDKERVAAILTQLQEVKINVSDDVGAQRTRLLDIAAQMDTMLPAPTAPVPETPAAPDAAETPAAP